MSEALKELLLTQPIVTFPDFFQTFCICTDTSISGLETIMAKVQDARVHHLLCHRSTNPSECN